MSDLFTDTVLILLSLSLGSLLTYCYIKHKCFYKDCITRRHINTNFSLSQSLRSDPYPITHSLPTENYTIPSSNTTDTITTNTNNSAINNPNPFTTDINNYPSAPGKQQQIHTNTLGEQVI